MHVCNDNYELHNTDCIPHMLDVMEESSVDMAVFSPPFPSLYAYSDAPGDIGNVDALGMEAKIHLSFFFNGLCRVLKPGRVAICHVCQIPRMKRSGGIGLCDFRGLVIRVAERAGLTYEYDWTVRKNPQAQAIRTRSRELQFAGLESDRAKTRGVLQDYLIKFTKPGDNAIPIRDWTLDETESRRNQYPQQVSRNDWIDWAEGCWHDIQETDTLNTAAAKSEDDTRHICPLQLEVIRRCVLLFSNPGELVFSPFTGIGSEGYVALGGKSAKTKKRIAEPRLFYGCELKPEYYQQAAINLDRAIDARAGDVQCSLFDAAGVTI